MTRRQRQTQRDDLLLLLKSRAPEWALLQEVMAAGGAQALGHRIENKQEDGRSYFRLVTNLPAAQWRPIEKRPTQASTPEEPDLLFSVPTEGIHRDPEEG